MRALATIIGAAALALAISVPAPARSQSLEPFLQALPSMAPDMPFVRCAGLYSAAVQAGTRLAAADAATISFLQERFGIHTVGARLNRGDTEEDLRAGPHPGLRDEVNAFAALYFPSIVAEIQAGDALLSGPTNLDHAVCEELLRQLTG